MGKISRIQLRGISRTPSDRMSEDGGLSESLNMYLDTAESAPAFVPKDVTEKLGLPADLGAERIFIHKTANYENYIVVQSYKVVAYTPGIEDEEPLLIRELAENEAVSDFTSIGNTVVMFTSANSYYFLFKGGTYKFIGNKIPFPEIKFITGEHAEVYTTNEYVRNLSDYYYESPYTTIGQLQANSNAIDAYFEEEYYKGQLAQTFPTEEEWNAASKNYSKINEILKKTWEAILAEQKENFPEYCAGLQIVRYAIRLYDGSLISSMPILVNPQSSFSSKATIKWHQENERVIEQFGNIKQTGKTTITVQSITPLFPITALLTDSHFYDGWEDIISDIIFYAAPATYLLGEQIDSIMTSQTRGSKKMTQMDSYTLGTTWDIESDITLGLIDKSNYESAIINASEQTFEIQRLSLIPTKITETINKLTDGLKLQFNRDQSILMTQDRLLGDDMAHDITQFKNAISFNNRVVAPAISSRLIFDHHNLNALQLTPKEGEVDSYVKQDYEVAFLIKNANGQDLCVRHRFSYNDGNGYEPQVFAFQTFPDNRCYKMLVKLTEAFVTGASGIAYTYYGEFDMKQFPLLNCSYMIGDYGQTLKSLCSSTKPEAWDALNSFDAPIAEIKNKLYVSKSDNPFYYPLESRYTFSSAVLATAIANTALSQGQFGQFPLYVFTEDGIWAMETAADGSFISQKPLSREVCINPDSICSIDNAVVFVTDKAVMMIQGSQVMNISPYMNGKHYKPNDSALNLIHSQEGFDTLIEPISDDDPFMFFMKDAKVAYDYTGQRLIFISPSNEGFQYVYKIDTQTWHKLAFSGFDLSTPLNSYPECLVMAERQGPKYLGNILEYTGLKNYDAFKDAIKNGKELNKIQMDAEPFPEEILEQLDVPVVKQEVISYFWWKIVVRETRDVAPSKAERDNLMRLTKWSAKELDDALLGKEIRADLYFPEDYWGDVEIFLNKFFEYEIEDGIDEGLVCIKYIIGEVNEDAKYAKVYSLSTVLDASTTQDTAKGILITRPFDLGMPDVYKTITDVRIRGQFPKGAVKFILQASNDWVNWVTISTLRGRAWKLFRIFVLADLEPTDRISWIDVQYETKFTNKLR